MKKIKIRFSYFLIAGILGVIFQLISFLGWNNGDVISKDLITQSTAEHFEIFIRQNYFSIVACALFIILSVGLILYSKKDKLIMKIGGYSLGISQLLIMVVTIIFISYTTQNRLTMLSETEQIKAINVLVYIRFIGLIFTSLSLAMVGYSFIKYKKESKFTQIGGLIGVILNGLLFVGLMTILIAGIHNQTFDVTNKIIFIDQTVNQKFELIHGSMNGFTLTHLQRVYNLIDEIILSGKSNEYGSLLASSIISFVVMIINLIVIIGNLLSLGFIMIQSFDVSEDEGIFGGKDVN